MATITRAKRRGKISNKLLKLAVVSFAVVLTLTLVSSGTQKSFWRFSSKAINYHVDESCKILPAIRPTGSFFLDANIKSSASSEMVSPSFRVGTIFNGRSVSRHMTTDIANFHLVKDFLKGKEGGLVFDIGANQGFYTYYLASMGMEVHSFEINEQNFKALLHGTEFNPHEVADRVNLYPVGLGEKNKRFDMKGAQYGGFLTDNNDAGGSILGVSFDCFAHHMQGKLDMSDVAFVRLDVVGFEIAVLKGSQNSLFKHSKIGGFLMEVGPDRWSRAAINFATGVDEMKKLAEHFKSSNVLLREDGAQAGTCPVTLAADVLSDKKPRAFDGVQMFVVKSHEWEPLLAKMEEKHYDCNFFYKN
jgi:FkbM family methyltransferase